MPQSKSSEGQGEYPTEPNQQQQQPSNDDAVEHVDTTRDFDLEILTVEKDRSLSRSQRRAEKKRLLAEQAAAEAITEKQAIRDLEAKLPRPSWYSSDDESDSFVSSEEAKEISELRSQPEGSAGYPSLILYTVLSFISFVFNLASSCPIPWMRSSSGRKYGVWSSWGGNETRLMVSDLFDCSQERQYWQAASAMSVIATFAAFGSVISGILLYFRKGHLGASLILSFYSMSFSLVAWSLVVALFHNFRCGKGVFADGVAHLDAGFALTLIAWVFHLAAIVVLGIYFLQYWTRSVHGGKPSAMRFIYVALTVVVMLFYCVGPAYTQWGKSFATVKVSVTMWHVEVYNKETQLSLFLSRRSYRCTTITRRMKVVAAFIIMACIWLFFSLVLGVGACYDTRYIRGSNFFGWAAALFSLVAWLVLIITRHGHLCTGTVAAGESTWADLGYNGIPTGIENAQIRFDGYALKEGFGLMVAGWALNTLAVLFNTILYDI